MWITCIDVVFISTIYISASTSKLLQDDIDYMATALQLKVQILDNLESTPKHRVCYSLTNTGNQPFKETGWVLYFTSFRSIEPDHLPLTGSVLLEDQRVNVTLFQGQFTAITPVAGFGVIQPNETKRLYFYNELWSVARCEVFPNWYLSSTTDDLEPRIVESTRNSDFVEPFVSEQQWKRYKEDVYNPFTPLERFDRYYVNDLGNPGKLVVPTPKRMVINDQEWVTLDLSSCKIYADGSLVNEINILKEATGCDYEQNTMATGNSIYLTAYDGTSEQYSLRINRSTNSVKIHGQSSAGVYYGVQTFLSILYSHQDGRLPVLSIDDWPRFSYRGMHLDVARNFHGVQEIKKLIKVMAMYKLNKLHLHLTDDDGWRLQIDGLKELTQVGGQRCHDLSELRCLLPQLGSGPFSNNSGSGFLTTADYQKILRFANHHHVEVIPEFDFPGHSHAAVRAMEARYQFYTNAGNKSAANEFRLKDPDDNSRYLSVQEFNDNAINPCIESTYRFIEFIVKTLVELHRHIQPLHTFHFGGDEVAKGAWVGSPACQRLQANNPILKGPREWKKFFVQRVSRITARYNLSLGGWEDGFIEKDNNPYPRDTLNNSDVIAYSWDNVWEWGAAARAYRMANKGYKVVMSHATHLYFDHPAEPDPEEWGLNWATRFTDTKKVFSFMPGNLYANIDTLLSGVNTSVLDVCGLNMEKCDKLQERQNVIGIQGQLWSEVVRTASRLNFMIFPRVLALAERAWHRAEWEGLTKPNERQKLSHEDWTMFANTLGYKELRRLDKLGIHYRVPPPGARVTTSKEGDPTVETCTEFPGLKIQYSRDNGQTWNNMPSSQLRLPAENVLLRTLSADGRRFSRIIQRPIAYSSNKGHMIMFSKSFTYCCSLLIWLRIFQLLF